MIFIADDSKVLRERLVNLLSELEGSKSLDRRAVRLRLSPAFAT